jgi:hypothetical protein
MASFITLTQAGGDEIVLNVDWIAWIAPHPKESGVTLIYVGVGRQYSDGASQSPALLLVENSFAAVRAALAASAEIVPLPQA